MTTMADPHASMPATTSGDTSAAPPAPAPARPESLVRRVLHELKAELWQVTGGLLTNSVLASPAIPRPLRWLGYRLLGGRIDTMAINPSLRVIGTLRLVEIGRGTFLNHGCTLETSALIHIGEDCAIAPEVMIVTSHHPRDEHGKLAKTAVGRPVTIGNRVWLGARAIVLPGATIADDIVIAAGATVSGKCDRPGVYAGTPARLIRPAD